MATHRGTGMATVEYPTGMNQNGDPSQAWIKVKPDGRVDLFSGTADIGNGSKTVQSQIVAETIGVPYDWVTYDNSNTDSSPMCTGTFASRATFVAGNAVLKAAEQVRDRILEIAAAEMEAAPGDLVVADGTVSVAGTPSRSMGVDEVAGAATFVHGQLLTGDGAHLTPGATITDPATGEVDLPPHSAISYAASVAEVEVDDETGDVKVLKLTQAYDIGKAMNPTLLEGQIDGGAVMGLGFGLLETCYPYYPSNEHRPPTITAYHPPTMDELPAIENVMIENPSSGGPYGAKGIGEMANNAQPAAIAIAIYNAVGVWVTEFPITPERLLTALDRKAAGEGEPRREGKVVTYDEDLSVNTVSNAFSWTS